MELVIRSCRLTRIEWSVRERVDAEEPASVAAIDSWVV